MVVGAACVSACAYLLGSAINQAYVARNFPDVIVISAATMVLFALKGFASYNQAVTMAHIGNEITAENQCRLFDKLLRQDVAFFGDRHSSEFSARISYGASSVSSVLAITVLDAVG